MKNINVEFLKEKPLEQHETELVERKGIGHPDTICDSIMEALGSASGEKKHSSAYISMIKQLTAAKLNLAVTDSLVPGATCLCDSSPTCT